MPDAKPLPSGTIFTLSDWDSDYEKCIRVYGEDPFLPKIYSKGTPPAGASGQKFCGKGEDFQTPKAWNPNAPVLRRGSNGLPICCGPQGAIVWTAPTVAAPGAIGMGYNLVQARGDLGLFATIAGHFCGGADMPLQLRVRITSADFPAIDGRILYLPQAPTAQPEIRWGSDYPLGTDLLRVFVQQSYSAMVGERLILTVQWGDFSPFGPGYLFALKIAAGGWGCSPFTFSETFEAFNEPSGTPTGKFVTLETY